MTWPPPFERIRLDPAAVTAAQESLRTATDDANSAIAAYGAHECAPRTELDPTASD